MLLSINIPSNWSNSRIRCLLVVLLAVKIEPAVTLSSFGAPEGSHPLKQSRRHLWLPAEPEECNNATAVTEACVCTARFISGTVSFHSSAPFLLNYAERPGMHMRHMLPKVSMWWTQVASSQLAVGERARWQLNLIYDLSSTPCDPQWTPKVHTGSPCCTRILTRFRMFAYVLYVNNRSIEQRIEWKHRATRHPGSILKKNRRISIRRRKRTSSLESFTSERFLMENKQSVTTVF